MTSAFLDNGGLPIALAHRGFSLDGLENSMAAFQAAIDLGYRYLETDGHGTADGVAVALHDTTLDRTTDAKGDVHRLSWREVRHIRIGGVEPIPKLEDVLGTWPEARVNIDVKAPSGIEPVAEAIERTGAHDRVCLASFSSERRRATIARLSRPVAASPSTSEIARFAAAALLGRQPRLPADVSVLQVPHGIGPVRVASRALVTAAARAGAPVQAWTVNAASTMTSLLDAGVTGIFTDRADRLKEVLVARGQWS